MEDKLKSLIESNSEANRNKWPLEWKKQGKKVIGVMSSYVPDEVIYASGMLPWHITGSWRDKISHVGQYRPQSSCSYCNHVLESLLSGELSFLDGIVIADVDQDLLRLSDVLVTLKKTAFIEVMHIPIVDSQINRKYLTEEIKRVQKSLEGFSGTNISAESLQASILSYNKMRSLLDRLYEFRKKEIPPLSGAEVLGITTAAGVMPVDQFNRELEFLLPYLENRRTDLKHVSPRLLVTSEMLDNPAYLKLVEEGCLVAMDDMDTGSRSFMQAVDSTLADPAAALAVRYLSRHGAPRMASWDKQAAQIVAWAKEYDIDGVLGLPLSWCYPQRYRMPYLAGKLDEAGIPNLCLERGYHLANVGQLRTRIGAFLEMLDVKQKTSGSR
jgi:benzoyl-CoA reductase/2-hydroxyglutaryl-CoA dehydratase subunit BcrC/BadD/HgdB